MSVDDWIGSVGVFLLLLAYFLNLIGAVATESRAYQALNGVGATIAAYASFRIGFLPFVVLEGTWAVVSAIALLRGPGRAGSS